MKFYILGSGSGGNCTIFEDDGVLLLIDMGLSFKRLKEGLKLINKNVIDLDCVLLTHEHSDHTLGLKYVYPLPIYCTKGTYDNDSVENIVPYQEFKIKDLRVIPVSTSHDVIDPVGFVLINKKNEKLVYLTDSGYIPDETIPYLIGADYYIFESNHDIEMELNAKRSMRTKKRIMSDFGHLSNEDSANYLADLIRENTKEIVLAHISREANTHELALETHLRIYKERNIDISNIKIHCADQFEIVSGGK